MKPLLEVWEGYFDCFSFVKFPRFNGIGNDRLTDDSRTLRFRLTYTPSLADLPFDQSRIVNPVNMDSIPLLACSSKEELTALVNALIGEAVLAESCGSDQSPFNSSVAVSSMIHSAAW